MPAYILEDMVIEAARAARLGREAAVRRLAALNEGFAFRDIEKEIGHVRPAPATRIAA